MTNTTLQKFGYPQGLIREYTHWCVLLRPAQATLGAVILGAKSDATRYSDLPAEAFSEMAEITKHIENVLMAFSPYDRINYLMLMMVDPHVHFHVLPRYEGSKQFAGVNFPDRGFPGPPNLAEAITPEPAVFDNLLNDLRQLWPQKSRS